MRIDMTCPILHVILGRNPLQRSGRAVYMFLTLTLLVLLKNLNFRFLPSKCGRKSTTTSVECALHSLSVLSSKLHLIRFKTQFKLYYIYKKRYQGYEYCYIT